MIEIELTDLQKAEAVIDGLADVPHCEVCGDRPMQYVATQPDQYANRIYRFCGACVSRFKSSRNIMSTTQAMRIMRFVAWRGWLDNEEHPSVVLERINTAQIEGMMLADPTFRTRWT